MIARFLFIAFMLALAPLGRGAELGWTDVLKTSLVFEAKSDDTRPYPNRLRVFLRLENIHDANVTWVSQDPVAFQAELLDEQGSPVPPPPSVASVLSSSTPHLLPVGSRLDWLISDTGGLSMAGDTSRNYALVIGAAGWFIPMDRVERYSLRITFYGRLWSREPESETFPYVKLFELPPTPIKLTPARETAETAPREPIRDASEPR